MTTDVVMGIPHTKFEAVLDGVKESVNVQSDNELTASHLREVVREFKELYRREGKAFPENVREQLVEAVHAVFESWESDRARTYRDINKITGVKGTAVTVQSMAFGNMGDTSGTGVVFTRSPSTGEDKLYGEFLTNAQGEDVVAGIRTPEPVSRMEAVIPEAFEELKRNAKLLEENYGDMMDVEFTVQNGTLFLLQCRSGKRTGQAAAKIAVDMREEG